MRTEIDGMEFDSDIRWKGHLGLIRWIASNKSIGHSTCTPGVYRGALQINFWLTAIAYADLSGKIDESKLPGEMRIGHARFYAKAK
jgi:hypothetical protein